MQSKVIFADQLRVLAFLSVVFVHWFATYFVMPPLVASVTGSALFPIPSLDFYEKMLPPFMPGFNYGPFGVSIFFLISGFVIPFSCEKRDGLSFLKARFFRIYMPYAVALGGSVAFAYLTSRYYWHTSYSVSPLEFISNVTLTNSIFGIRSLDIVNWSLSVEVKFYILCFFIVPYLRAGYFFPFLIFGIASVFINMFFGDAKSQIPMEMMFITYMSVGVLFNYLISRRITLAKFSFLVLIQMALFAASLHYSSRSSGFFIELMSPIYALIIFGVCYALRERFIDFRFLRFTAAITYPVYILHFIIGLGLIKICVNEGLSFPLAVAIAFASVILLSTALHFLVEKKSVELGRSNAAGFS